MILTERELIRPVTLQGSAEGEIEFFGRIDNQIKLRGLRIELGEIEEVINSYEGIITSITLPVDNKFLCCYFMLTARSIQRSFLPMHQSPWLIIWFLRFLSNWKRCL